MPLTVCPNRFRWVHCQLQALAKSTKPKSIQKALLNLPDTLNETYKRMLMNIPKENQREALLLLQWVTYAKSPLTLR